MKNQPFLIGTALLAVYIVLGMLYESLIHPLTIISTLPSAGVGALMALVLFNAQLDIIAMIGIFLLIGIVKKNAIMMIDFALAAERNEGLNTRDAIFRACLLRFRPIMMTTSCALLGGMPLALGWGAGAELRKPLGIAIVGGLLVSQMLTLFTCSLDPVCRPSTPKRGAATIPSEIRRRRAPLCALPRSPRLPAIARAAYRRPRRLPIRTTCSSRW